MTTDEYNKICDLLSDYSNAFFIFARGMTPDEFLKFVFKTDRTRKNHKKAEKLFNKILAELKKHVTEGK